MSVVADIMESYRRPRHVVRRLLDMGAREDRALIILMGACIIVFVAQWPRLSREAHLQGSDLQMQLAATLFAWLFIMPLVLYGLGFLMYLVLRAMGGRGSGFDVRMALFWALLASTPLILLSGLVAGFVGPGAGLNLVGVIWLVCFLWFFLSGMREAWAGGAGGTGEAGESGGRA
ncbi:MAG: YIP1 family protein [Rhodobacterales bacterium]|nr:MAG: YIP1 family protein [Rhodobacterales bacterium]